MSDEIRILEDHLHVATRRAHPRAREASTFSPRNSTSPDVGSISRSMQRPVVLLPLPDSPTSPKVSPSSMVKLTSSTARTIVLGREQPAAAGEVLHEMADFDERHQERTSPGAGEPRSLAAAECR